MAQLREQLKAGMALAPSDRAQLVAQFKADKGIPLTSEEHMLLLQSKVAAHRVARTQRERVQQALERDTAHRHVGVTGDLFALDEVKVSAAAPDGTVPVVRPSDAPERVVCSLAEFRERAKHSLGPLADCHMKNIVIAGGAVGALMCAREVNDIDVFIHGLDEERARARVDELVAHVHKWHSAFKRTIIVSRNVRCVTLIPVTVLGDKWELMMVHTDFPPIQIILCAFGTMSEVLHSFDLGSSQAAYDGDNVWLTSLGKLAYEEGINVVSVDRRRRSYEHRIAKYYRRGFGLALPDLDLAKAKQGRKGILPLRALHFAAGGWNAAANALEYKHVHPVSFTRINTKAESKEAGPERKEAGPEPLYEAPSYANTLKQALQNFAIASRPVLVPQALCAQARYVSGMSVASVRVQFADQVVDVAEKLLAGDKVNLAELKKYLGADLAAKLIAGKLAAEADYDPAPLVRVVAAAMEERAVIPYEFRAAAEAITPRAPSNAFGTEVVPAATWYGDYYAEPAPATAAAVPTPSAAAPATTA